MYYVKWLVYALKSHAKSTWLSGLARWVDLAGHFIVGKFVGHLANDWWYKNKVSSMTYTISTGIQSWWKSLVNVKQNYLTVNNPTKSAKPSHPGSWIDLVELLRARGCHFYPVHYIANTSLTNVLLEKLWITQPGSSSMMYTGFLWHWTSIFVLDCVNIKVKD